MIHLFLLVMLLAPNGELVPQQLQSKFTYDSVAACKADMPKQKAALEAAAKAAGVEIDIVNAVCETEQQAKENGDY